MLYQLPKSPYCVILGNGEYPHISICKNLIAGANLTVCSDGGANFALQNELIPDLIIGDLDSIHDQARQHYTDLKVLITALRSQELNDLEKSLNYITDRYSFNSFVLLGFLGLREDHSYATLQIVEKQTSPAVFQVYSKTAEYLILPPGDYEFHFPVKHPLSVFAMPEAGNLTTTGLKWNLSGATLSRGSRGLSNISTKSAVHFSFDSGKILLIHLFQF